MVKAGKMMWNETTKPNCKRARKRGSDQSMGYLSRRRRWLKCDISGRHAEANTGRISLAYGRSGRARRGGAAGRGGRAAGAGAGEGGPGGGGAAAGGAGQGGGSAGTGRPRRGKAARREL